MPGMISNENSGVEDKVDTAGYLTFKQTDFLKFKERLGISQTKRLKQNRKRIYILHSVSVITSSGNEGTIAHSPLILSVVDVVVSCRPG